jgi:hypothetical protein
MHPRLRYVIGTGVILSMKRHARRFLAQLSEPRAVQQRLLSDLVALNSESEFGRLHGLNKVRTPGDLRRQVPVTNYAYYEPWIEKVKQGRREALLGRRNTLLMFALTSGTTGHAKFLPVTERFLADYRRGWKIWSIRTFCDHPELFFHEMVQLTGDHEQFRTAGGFPCGNISGLVTAMQNRLVRTLFAVPEAVSKIPSHGAKYYAAMRFALANRIVGMITTANPSALVQLAKTANEHSEEMIRDIHDGTLSDRFDIPGRVRDALRRRLRRRDPRRARELEQVVARTGTLYPRDCWPALSLLAVWIGGSAAAYIPSLRRYYGEVPIRDHGLSASEGRMTIPLCDGRPDGVLDITSHCFEFIPEEEYGKDDPTVLECHELKEGNNYYILLTNSAGLYRYDIRDVVRCTGFCGRTPLLAFLNKGAHMSSITGEKISEWQVVTAVREAAQALEVEPACYCVVPSWGELPGYRLLIEVDDLPSAGIGILLAESADERLQKLNIEYGEKRRSGRLAPLEHTSIARGSWERLMRQRQSRLGASAEQYKHPFLIPDLTFSESFVREEALPV